MKVLRDNISNHIALYRSMKEHDGLESYSGGRSILEEMSWDENATYQRYYNAQPLNAQLNYTMSGAEFAHKQIAIAVVMSGLEKRMNSGPEAFIDLAASRYKIAEQSFLNNFEADLISDGSADSGLQIGGLKSIVSKTPSSGSVGGIDRASAAGSFYQNFKFATTTDVTSPAPGEVATSASNIKDYYNYCINQLRRGSDKPTFIIAGQAHYQFLQSALFAMQRITDEKRGVDGGFRELEYLGIPVVMSGGVNFGGQTYIQSDASYFLNTKYLKLRYHKDANMEPLEELRALNAEVWCQLIIWMGNMTCSNARLQGVMFDS
jgi:hypothetical protein